MVRDDVPVAIEMQIKRLLFTLPDTVAGQAMLKNMETDAFYPADNHSYQMVADYLAKFERNIRSVGEPW